MTFDEAKTANLARNAAIAAVNARIRAKAEMPFDVRLCLTDFEFWASHAVRIRDKQTGRDVPFVLNRAQHRVLQLIEGMRQRDEPIRLIMLKARQWGGSTLIQMYMAWLQLTRCHNWHSVICAHVKDSARNIRAMYSKLLDNYPPELQNTDAPYRLVGFEGAQNVKLIAGRDCRITIASAENQDSVRGSDIAMAHLSEVAFWKATPKHDPEDFLRAICSSIPLQPLTFLAIESTANGVGNFFHEEWNRACLKKSDKAAVFVPWYENDIYALPFADEDSMRRFWETLTPYERFLWEDRGCTLEQIHWYRRKLAEYPKAELMQAEFPTTPVEAFTLSDSNVFANADIEALRHDCAEPAKGELNDSLRFTPCPNGELEMWEQPQSGARYIVTVDIGGRCASADFSVILVMKVAGRPEVVAQWRGHTYHDILARNAIRISRAYNDALLVIESNTLETAAEETISATVLSHVAANYRNVYRRQAPRNAPDKCRRIGFHVNSHTKALIVNNLMSAVRDRTYVERSHAACNELVTYCRLDSGSFEARRGCHDDLLMTRAIALFVIADSQRLFRRNDDAEPPRVFGGW